MFSNHARPPDYARIDALAQTLKKLEVWETATLTYRHADGLYRLTYVDVMQPPDTRPKPVFEDRGYRAGELTDRLKREIGLLELEWHLHREDMATGRYRPEHGDYMDEMAAPGDRAFINALVAQTDL
ncbi:MAG: hypothetical protein ACE369_10550 [Roseovarius sp.]